MEAYFYMCFFFKIASVIDISLRAWCAGVMKMTSTVNVFNKMPRGMKIDPTIYTEVPAHCPA